MKLVGKKNNRESLLRLRQQNYSLKSGFISVGSWSLNRMGQVEKSQMLKPDISVAVVFQSAANDKVYVEMINIRRKIQEQTLHAI